jgi:antitoxin component YwqK of YwqJK toxin-antitoxin module
MHTIRIAVGLVLVSWGAAACGAANGHEPRCPPGTSRVDRAADSTCQTADGVLEGPLWARYPDGRLRFYATARNGLVEGTWTSWHANGERSIEAEYHGGQLDGRFRMWDVGGHLLYEGFHDAHGQMDGTWTRWWPNGRERACWEMREGRQQGVIEAWYPSGERRMQGQRTDGRADGRWRWWDEDGHLTHACRYEAGRVVEGVCGTLRD